MKLGDLIETLEALPADAPIRFRDGTIPNGLVSWRGSYDELTIDSGIAGKTDTVGKLLQDARAADGKTFHGYKGGEYAMNLHTPVWADPWGESNCMVPSVFAIDRGIVVISTFDLSVYR